MSKKISILIPFESKDPDRLASLDLCKRRLHALYPDWEIVTGGDDSGKPEYCKPRMMNNAAKKATGDIFCFVDQDLWFPREVLIKCIDALKKISWCTGFTRCHRLSKEYTQKLLAMPIDSNVLPGKPEILSTHNAPGPIMVMPRAAWEAIGGCSERIWGWGEEDMVNKIVLNALWGDGFRIDQDIYHLFHEPYAGKCDRTQFVQNCRVTSDCQKLINARRFDDLKIYLSGEVVEIPRTCYRAVSHHPFKPIGRTVKMMDEWTNMVRDLEAHFGHLLKAAHVGDFVEISNALDNRGHESAILVADISKPLQILRENKQAELDLITVFGGLNELAGGDLDQAIENIHRHLADEGLLIVLLDDKRSPAWWEGRLSWRFDPIDVPLRMPFVPGKCLILKKRG